MDQSQGGGGASGSQRHHETLWAKPVGEGASSPRNGHTPLTQGRGQGRPGNQDKDRPPNSQPQCKIKVRPPSPFQSYELQEGKRR